MKLKQEVKRVKERKYYKERQYKIKYGHIWKKESEYYE